MNPRRLVTWLLFLAVAAALWFMSEAVDQRAEEAENQTKRIVRLDDPLNVRSFEISGTQVPKTIRIERRDKEHRWVITAPVEWEADGLAVGRLLSAVMEGKIAQRIKAPGELKQFGLAPPDFKLTLTDRSGDQAVLLLGELNPDEKFTYGAVPGGKEVWMLAPQVRGAVDQTMFELRNKVVLDFVVNQVTSINLNTGKTTLGLKRIRGGAQPLWKFADGAEADSETVEDLLFQVHGLRTLDFMDEGIKPELMGLAPPSGLVELGLAKGGQQSLALGGPVPGRDETYLRRQAGGPVMVVKSASLAPLRQINRFQLSQRRLLRFDRDLAVALSVKRGGMVIKYTKEQGRWRRTQPPGDLKSGEVAALLAWDLGNLKWRKILDKNAALGLDKPQAVITLTLQTKAEAGTVENRVLSLGKVDKASGLLAVWIPGDKRIFGLKADFLSSLPQASKDNNQTK